MDAARWSRLKEAFTALSELAPPEQDAALAALKAVDPDLARRVNELLAADSRADALLRRFELTPDPNGMASGDAVAPAPQHESRASVEPDPFGYAGQAVAQYRVRDVLGIGGMGVVYRAEDMRLGRVVALKFLLPQYSLDPDARERFLREARAASTLDHPNVCTVYGVETSERGHLFISMACYDGETLKTRLARSPLPLDDTIAITRQVLLALRAAHEAGVVHRDLKPGNVMLLPDGTVRILDFGLAKVSDLSLTGPGLRPGTVAYMSPEQVEGKPLDHRTDLWSLGVVLYEMASGRRPFGGGHDLSTVYAILNEEPCALSQVRPGIPPAYDGIVHRLLQKDRDRRYSSAADVSDDLEAAAAGKPVSAGHAAGRWRAPRSRRLVAVGAVTCAFLLAAALVAIPRVRDARTSRLTARVTPLRTVARETAVDPRSVAVLPFADMSPAGDHAYFSDGIAEEILNALARVNGLRVPARTSSFSFQGRNLTVREIARELGVASVLEGSIRRDGPTVRITAQLIDARTDRHLWSQTFDRDVADVFTVQSEIARTVAEALRVRLADGSATVAPSPNARAHDLYLLGRFHWNRRTGEDLRRAIGHFESAARADSSYARAYAGLAMAHAVLPINTGDTPPDAPLQRAVTAAKRAIALDPSNAEAHAALGYAYHMQWRWKEAEVALRRATELEPTNTTARQWYGEHLVKMGRGREAEAEVRRAVALDPLSPIAHANLALVLMLDRRYEEATAQAERTSRMDPSFSIPLLLLHRLHFAAGRADESATAGRRFAELRGMRNADDFVTLARGTRTSADRAAALVVLDRWQRDPRPMWPDIAMYAAMLGERERALNALDEALRIRAPMLAGLRVARWFDPLRGDPRFERVLRALQFP